MDSTHLRPRQKAILVALALVLLAAGAAWGTSAVMARATRTAALARVPDLPDASQVSVALRQALIGADRAVRQVIRAGEPEDEIGRTAGRLGQLYQANLYRERAIQCYQLAMDLDSGNPRWPYLLAFLRQESGESGSVAGLLQRTVDLAPEYSPAWLKLAENQFKQGRQDRAGASYERRLALSPGDPYAHLGLARLALAVSQWEVAQSHLERAIEAGSSFGVVHRLLASVHEHFGRPQQMQEALDRAGEAGRFHPAPDPWVDSLLEQCFDVEWLLLNVNKYSWVGDGAVARMIFDRAMELDPKNPEVYLALGQNVQTMDEARLAFEAAIVLDPENARAHALLGETLLNDNKPQQAIPLLLKALELGDDASSTYGVLGICLATAGRYEEAIAYVERALELAPEALRFHYSLARILRSAGRREEAVQQYRRLLQLNPTHAGAAEDLAALLK